MKTIEQFDWCIKHEEIISRNESGFAESASVEFGAKTSRSGTPMIGKVRKVVIQSGQFLCPAVVKALHWPAFSVLCREPSQAQFIA